MTPVAEARVRLSEQNRDAARQSALSPLARAPPPYSSIMTLVVSLVNAWRSKVEKKKDEDGGLVGVWSKELSFEALFKKRRKDHTQERYSKE